MALASVIVAVLTTVPDGALMGLIAPVVASDLGADAVDRAADVASHRLKHHQNWHPVPEWVRQQVYLHPYRKELMLRNHV